MIMVYLDLYFFNLAWIYSKKNTEIVPSVQCRSLQPNNIHHFCASGGFRFSPKVPQFKTCRDNLAVFKHPLPLGDSEIGVGDFQIRNPDEKAYHYKYCARES